MENLPPDRDSNLYLCPLLYFYLLHTLYMTKDLPSLCMPLYACTLTLAQADRQNKGQDPFFFGVSG